MITSVRSEVSENESYTHTMSFEMRAAARCGMPTEASRFTETDLGGYFLTGF